MKALLVFVDDDKCNSPLSHISAQLQLFVCEKMCHSTSNKKNIINTIVIMIAMTVTQGLDIQLRSSS